MQKLIFRNVGVIVFLRQADDISILYLVLVLSRLSTTASFSCHNIIIYFLRLNICLVVHLIIGNTLITLIRIRKARLNIKTLHLTKCISKEVKIEHFHYGIFILPMNIVHCYHLRERAYFKDI